MSSFETCILIFYWSQADINMAVSTAEPKIAGSNTHTHTAQSCDFFTLVANLGLSPIYTCHRMLSILVVLVVCKGSVTCNHPKIDQKQIVQHWLKMLKAITAYATVQKSDNYSYQIHLYLSISNVRFQLSLISYH